MCRADILVWARGKDWNPIFPCNRDRVSIALAYAECGGPSDPHCGRTRFSSHGCGGAPTRDAYLKATTSEMTRWVPNLKAT
jgi:hypothetical protein